jgi:hypothetical protein
MHDHPPAIDAFPRPRLKGHGRRARAAAGEGGVRLAAGLAAWPEVLPPGCRYGRAGARAARIARRSFATPVRG